MKIWTTKHERESAELISKLPWKTEIHPLVRDKLVGFFLGNLSSMTKHNGYVKILVKGPLIYQSLIKDLYFLVKNLKIMRECLSESEQEISFHITDPYLIKYFFYFFYLDERFDVVLSKEDSQKKWLRNPQIETSWGSRFYNTIDNEKDFKRMRKYLSRRLLYEQEYFTSCSFVSLFVNLGFYDWILLRYTLDISYWDLDSLDILYSILRQRFKLPFIYEGKQLVFFLKERDNSLIESCLNLYLPAEFSWKMRNYHPISKYNQYAFYCKIFFSFRKKYFRKIRKIRKIKKKNIL